MQDGGQKRAFYVKVGEKLYISVVASLVLDLSSRNTLSPSLALCDATRAVFSSTQFVGEGVDDHGGPYRATFQSAAGDEPSGALRLLEPCANARAGAATATRTCCPRRGGSRRARGRGARARPRRGARPRRATRAGAGAAGGGDGAADELARLRARAWGDELAAAVAARSTATSGGCSASRAARHPRALARAARARPPRACPCGAPTRARRRARARAR